MADDSKSDIVMMFVGKNGETVWAESTLDVRKSDGFMAGFTAITDYNDYSNFFEVKSFNYTMKVAPHEQDVSSMSQNRTQSHKQAHGPHVEMDQFARWRSASKENYFTIDFPIAFDSFSFTRVIDGASPLFFDACCNQTSFQKAVLVKRVATGGQGGTERQSMGYLRFDFRDVLLIKVDWDDGDLVTESCTFICKAMCVRYRQQYAYGGFEDPSAGRWLAGADSGTMHAQWDQNKDGQVNGSRGA